MTAKDVATNTVTLAEGAENPALYKSEIEIAQANFISGVAPGASLDILARVRYRQPLSRATLSPSDGGRFGVVFDAPQKFVAPGQSAVFYSSEKEMLGGGVIL